MNENNVGAPLSLTPSKPRNILTTEILQACLSEHHGGATMRELCEKYNVGRGTLFEQMRRAESLIILWQHSKSNTVASVRELGKFMEQYALSLITISQRNDDISEADIVAAMSPWGNREMIDGTVWAMINQVNPKLTRHETAIIRRTRSLTAVTSAASLDLHNQASRLVENNPHDNLQIQEAVTLNARTLLEILEVLTLGPTKAVQEIQVDTKVYLDPNHTRTTILRKGTRVLTCDGATGCATRLSPDNRPIPESILKIEHDYMLECKTPNPEIISTLRTLAERMGISSDAFAEFIANPNHPKTPKKIYHTGFTRRALSTDAIANLMSLTQLEVTRTCNNGLAKLRTQFTEEDRDALLSLITTNVEDTHNLNAAGIQAYHRQATLHTHTPESSGKSGRKATIAA